MSTGRAYSSSLREERAMETRRRIRAAAAELFTTNGFTGTTVASIAEHAGVATPTVYSVFGSKAGIVAAMLEELEQNADRDVWVNQLMASEDADEQVVIFASWIRNLYAGGEAIIRAALAAAGEPDVAAFTGAGDQARRDGTRELAKTWAARHALRDDLDVAEAADRFWLLTSVELYLFARDRLGWSPDHYEEWLAELLARELLAS